ncbi:MAG: ribonuclease III [Calditrichota bacterium]
MKKFFNSAIKNKEADNNNNSNLSDFSEQLNRFQQKTGISFNDTNLLITAFKHRSYLNVTNEERVASNERLEFLGDAVLDLIVTDYLYGKFPKRTEGQLSKIKSILVSKPVLAEIATNLSLGNFILINKGEEKTGGRKRQSILADTLEAVLGALYLDQGMEITRTFIQDNLFTNFKSIMQRELYRNYKSILLEYAQSNLNKLPEYKVVNEIGPDHNKEFIISVYLNGQEVGRGRGKSKKMAEQEAAKFALQKIGLLQNLSE